jgi:tungstate transport system ATP-binding protein
MSAALAEKEIVELRGLRKYFGDRLILNDVGLSVSAGRAYVLTGDNGSGKSTLMRILAGLEPGEGTLSFKGREISLAFYPEPLRRDIVYVHQHPYLFHTDLAHNIAYGLRARGEPTVVWRPKVEAAIAWAGVGHLLHTPPHKLSGGERQRVALARAKVLAPALYLLDEPTANLDAEARSQVLALIEEIGQDSEAAVLVACHDRELIELPGMARLHLAEGRIMS